MNILIINGPNLNMLGKREPDVYGHETYQDLLKKIKSYATQQSCDVTIFQSNHEGDIIDTIQNLSDSHDGLIINPGAFTHYSYAIRDCISSISIPTIEIHISNILEREDFRKISVIKDVVGLTIMGRGTQGYLDAIDEMIKIINS